MMPRIKSFRNDPLVFAMPDAAISSKISTGFKCLIAVSFDVFIISYFFVSCKIKSQITVKDIIDALSSDRWVPCSPASVFHSKEA